MKLNQIALALLVAIATNSSAQSFKAKNSLFIEVSGSTGSLMGICYEGIISERSRSFWSISTGIGFFPSLDEHMDQIVGVPLLLNHASGLKNSHFEVGFGFTYTNGLIQQIQFDVSGEEISTLKLEALYGSGRIAYRFQRSTGGFLFKVSLCPMYRLANMGDYDDLFNFLIMPGIAMGYSF